MRCVLASLLSRAKPQVVLRPLRLPLFLYRRFLAAAPGLQPLRVPWGTIVADTRDEIGRSVWLHGLYELNVCEALTRLVDSGETCVDAGANIGVMSTLMASRTGAGGKVLAYEPHPRTSEYLRVNCAMRPSWSKSIRVRVAGLDEASGLRRLSEPLGFHGNCGLAKVDASAGTITIQTVALDEELQGQRIAVLKIDVEGAECKVLRGAVDLLRRGLVRDVIFENGDSAPGETHELLKRHGFAIWRIERSLMSLVLRRSGRNPDVGWEPTTYLASTNPDRVVQRMRPRGWNVLKRESFALVS